MKKLIIPFLLLVSCTKLLTLDISGMIEGDSLRVLDISQVDYNAIEKIITQPEKELSAKDFTRIVTCKNQNQNTVKADLSPFRIQTQAGYKLLLYQDKGFILVGLIHLTQSQSIDLIRLTVEYE